MRTPWELEGAVGDLLAGPGGTGLGLALAYPGVWLGLTDGAAHVATSLGRAVGSGKLSKMQAPKRKAPRRLSPAGHSA